MLGKLGDVFVNIIARDNQFRSTISSLGAIVSGGLILRGIDAAASSMSGLVDQGFAYNSAIEKATVSFNTLVGSERRAAALMEELRVFAAKTPFELPTLNKSAVALLATKKIASNEVLPILQKLGDAAAGSSEGFASMPRITRAISQMLTKGKIQAEEMMQLSEAGVPAWSALAEKMKMSTAEVQKLGEKGKLGVKEIKLLIDGLGDTYKGLADKQSQTYEGLSSTIKDNVGKALGDVFKPAFLFAERKMAKIVEMFDDPRFQKFVDKLASGLDRAIVAGEKFANSPMAKSAAKMAAIVAGVATLAGTIGLASSAASMLFSAAPVIAFGSYVAVLATLIERAFNGPEGETFRQLLRDSWTLIVEIGRNLKDVFLPVFGMVGTKAGDVFGANGIIQTGFNGFLKSALTGFAQILNYASIMTADFGATWDWMKLSAAGVAIDFREGFIYTLDTVIPFAFAGLLDGMLAGVKTLGERWRDVFEGVIEYAKTLMQGMLDAQETRLKGLLAAAQEVAAGRPGSAAATLFDANAKAAGQQVTANINALKAFNNRAGLALTGSFEAFKSGFKKTWDAMPDQKRSEVAIENDRLKESAWNRMVAARDQKRLDRYKPLDIAAGVGDKLGESLKNIGGAVFGNLAAGGKAATVDVVGGIDKIGDGFKGLMEAKEPAKPRKSEFIGLADMNKKIQEQLGKAKDEADKKKMMVLNEKQVERLKEIAADGKRLVDVSKGILKKIGMGD